MYSKLCKKPVRVNSEELRDRFGQTFKPDIVSTLLKFRTYFKCSSENLNETKQNFKKGHEILFQIFEEYCKFLKGFCEC